MAMTLGEEIKEALKAKKMTQVELARQTGISIATIGAYASNRSYPSLEKLQKMEIALGTIFEQYPMEKRKKSKIVFNETADIVGKNIKYVLQKKGITQKCLSELTGVSRPTMNKIITGKNNPNILVLNNISKVLGVSINQLLDKDFQQKYENKDLYGDLGILIVDMLKSFPKNDRERLASWLLED